MFTLFVLVLLAVSASQLGATGSAAATSSVAPVQVSAGDSHTCAVLSDGTVECWGSNYASALGNGATVDSPVPVEVSGISNATQVSAGTYNNCLKIKETLSDGGVEFKYYAKGVGCVREQPEGGDVVLKSHTTR